jgi:hypothetical protein
MIKKRNSATSSSAKAVTVLSGDKTAFAAEEVLYLFSLSRVC